MAGSIRYTKLKDNSPFVISVTNQEDERSCDMCFRVIIFVFCSYDLSIVFWNCRLHDQITQLLEIDNANCIRIEITLI